MLHYIQTPVQQIFDERLAEKSIKLFVKREDLNSRTVSGNKWWKLKYNLAEAIATNQHSVLTFGGAYSNHIYAVAAATHELHLQSIGVIRGEEILPLNATLQAAKDMNMALHYISREEYRNKSHAEFLDLLRNTLGDFYLIPEGGSNALGVHGITEFAGTLDRGFDYLCCPVGTGATLAGLVRGLNGEKKIIGFTVLKGGDSWIAEIEKFNPGNSNWQLIHNYHAGGYAKMDSALRTFMERFQREQELPIDRVYTGKMFHGIFDLVVKNFFEPGSRILAIHTGGVNSSMAS